MKLTIDRIYHKFLTTYHEALYNKAIIKPISWSLYQTWKWADEKEKPREGEQDEADN